MIVLSWDYNKAHVWLDELPIWEVKDVQVVKLLLLDKHAVSEEGLLTLIQTELTKQGIRRFGEEQQ